MSGRALLSRLDKVRRTGQGRWLARCPAHNDRGPSLSIRELDDGRLLVHCFAGCDIGSVLSSLSLDMDVLFPEGEIRHAKSERRPFPASDVLRCIAFEALVVATAGAAILARHAFSQIDSDRLIVAVGRIQAALSTAGLDLE